MTTNRIYNVAVSATIALALMLLAGIWRLGNNSMIACGFFGAFLIDLGTRPSFKRFIVTVATGAGFAILYGLITNNNHKAFGSGISAVAGAGAFLGLGSIMVLSCLILWTGAKHGAILRSALTLPVFSFIAGVNMEWLNKGATVHYDYHLYAFDNALGLTPGLTIAGWFKTLPWLGTASSVAYASVLIFPPLFHGWGSRQARLKFNVMLAFVVTGVIGIVLYQICPAMGPLYVFHAQFPHQMPASGFSLAPFTSVGVNNAMPSLHMTWALLSLVIAWELGPWAKSVAILFAALTALATIGSGEHYFIDLVVAVPLVLATTGICTKRYKLAVAGVTMVIVWTVALRLNWLLSIPPAANWLLVLGTMSSIGLIWWTAGRTASSVMVMPVPPELSYRHGLRAQSSDPSGAQTR
jgi:PAP2 superfamily